MDLDEKGLATRRAVLGDAHVDSALGKATPFTAPLQEPVTRHARGNPWQRKNLDLRTRSIATVSMLAALGRMHELKIHVRGALNNGITKEDAAGEFGRRTFQRPARDGLQNPRATLLPGVLRSGDDASHEAS